MNSLDRFTLAAFDALGEHSVFELVDVLYEIHREYLAATKAENSEVRNEAS